MKTILLLGPPGSGKGTTAQWLAEKYGFIHFSTGQIFRSLSTNTSVTATKINQALGAGELVSDSLTNALVKEELAKIIQTHQHRTIILDGYPRTLAQAEFFDKNFELNQVLLIECSEGEIIMRLSNRLLCTAADHSYHKIFKPPKKSGICDIDQSVLYQRKDDQKDVVLKRLRVYEELTAPLIQYYEKQNKIVEISNTNSIKAMHDEIIDALNLPKKSGQ